jgi:hypothetical protein
MLSIVHGPTGAFISSKIPNPFISIPLILASHYLEDHIPHWDVGQGLTKKKKSKKAAFLEELFIDFPLSIIFILVFFQIGKPFDYRIWIGWFFGLLPDFLEFPHLFLGTRITPFRQLAAFHTWCHRSTPSRFWGLLPQFLVITAILLLK